MRRRDFITLVGGATIAWPLAARAQQASKVYRVGWFFSSTPLAQMIGPDPILPLGRTIVHRLRDLGYVEGQNLILERRSAEGKFERIDEIATELVGRKPDAILTGAGNMLAQALQRVTKTIPIVMPDSDDPVGAGLVESLARPGGNITGFANDTGPGFESKRLELLKEVVPGAIRVAFLGTMDVWKGPAGQGVRAAAQALKVNLIHTEHTPKAYDDAFALMIRDRPDAIFVARQAANYVNAQLIADFAIEQRLPGIYPYKFNTVVGGLMSYGVNETDLYRRAVGIVDRVLKGVHPADIPIEQPTKFELVINLKTAKALGLDVPLHLQQPADEIIE
jgi:putative tryptophan/tyrosine transport system substrate-binding protein